MASHSGPGKNVVKQRITKTHLVIIIVVALLTAASLALIGYPWRAYEAARLLSELSALGASTPDRRTPPMMRAPVTYEVAGRSYRGDVYRPLAAPRAGIVLLHGAAPLGKDDPRLVTFAATLANAHFVVLVPDLADLRKLKLRAAATQEVVDAVLYIRSSANLVSQQQGVGVVALSVAAGPAVIAASQTEIRDRLRFIFTIGGYYDLLATLAFATTGYVRDEGERYYRQPNEYGKWVLVLSNVDKLADPSDRQVLAEMARRKLANQQLQVDAMTLRLSPEGRALYSFITNSDPERVDTLFAQLPTEIKSEITALSPSHKDLSTVRAQAILVHGYDDPVIPYSESIALADALPQGQTRLFLVNGLFHVELKPTVIDYWRLWRAMYTLLAERDR